MLDAALKTTDVRPGLLRVEREFGTLEIHSFFQEAVQVAGREALAKFDLTELDRWKPEVVSVKTISNMDAYEAQLVNRMARGGQLLKGQTLCVIEVSPAAYVMLAANEAEKAAEINILEVRAFGSFGRVYLGGEDKDIDVAWRAAETAIENVSGRVIGE